MMELSRKGEYAMRGMLYLARLPGAQAAPIGVIAAATEVPRNFVAKIMQGLVRLGLVDSFRGAQGGFALARPASAITMREIVVAVEGPVLPNRCLLREGVCAHSATCSVHAVWREVQGAVVTILDRVTLAELARRGAEPRRAGDLRDRGTPTAGRG